MIDRQWSADFDEGYEAYLANIPYDPSQSEAWKTGWDDAHELQSRSYSQTRLQSKV